MTSRQVAPSWSPWRTVVWFGLVSLSADMVYEGARAITGPFLAGLGASALVVGIVTGAGEAAALVLRLVSGPMADRTGRYWSLTFVGYGLTAVCVPLLAIAPFLGGAGLAVGASLVVLERTGKAIRSPAKSALLAHAAAGVGRGRGFAVHKAIDQVGAFAGPLLVAGVIAAHRTDLARPGRPRGARRLVPGVARGGAPPGARPQRLRAQRLRAQHHRARPRRGACGAGGSRPGRGGPGRVKLSRSFYVVAVATSLSTLGLMTFGVISFHLVDAQVVSIGLVPVIYAAAMAAGAVAALATGEVYDRIGSRVLVALPVLVSAVPLLAFDTRLGVVLTGVLVWGAATGLQDSTVKALVADLVPAARLATAYGVFAACQGAAALAGGIVGGALYDDGVADLVVVVGACQVVSLVLLLGVVRRPRGADARPARQP